MPFEQLKMKLEKKQEEEDGGGAEKTAAKQRPRKKIFENIKFEEGVRALREEKEKFMLGEKENSCPNVVKDEESRILQVTISINSFVGCVKIMSARPEMS